LRRSERLAGHLGERYRERIELRSRRVPLQHVTGEQEFHGLTFRIDARALVPRPETEGLVDRALELRLPPQSAVAELGAGSGCVVVTLARERGDLCLHAIERSPAALGLARENAERHGVASRIDWVEGDFAAAPDSWSGRMDAVLANPPYVSESEWESLDPEVRDHDPKEALVAGPTGYEAHRRVVDVSRRLLRPGGWLLLEIGAGQERTGLDLLRAGGFSALEVRRDLRGIPRILAGRLEHEGEGNER
jgi:release factor glutamine methyltransferase